MIKILYKLFIPLIITLSIAPTAILHAEPNTYCISADIIFDSGLTFDENDKLKVSYTDMDDQESHSVTFTIQDVDEGDEIAIESERIKVDSIEYVGENTRLSLQEIALPDQIYSGDSIKIAIGNASTQALVNEIDTLYIYDPLEKIDEDANTSIEEETTENNEDIVKPVGQESSQDNKDSDDLVQRWKESKPLLQLLKKVLPLTTIFVVVLAWAYKRKRNGKW